MTVLSFPSANRIELRRYRPGDGDATLNVFWDAVRLGAAAHYTEAERGVWARTGLDLSGVWAAQRASHPTWVAEVQGRIVGFSDLRPDGEVDMLYVHPDHTRRGIGGALLDEVERCAREADLPRLHARASRVAQPLFLRHGFITVREQWAEIDGERLAQAVMEKLLEPVI